MVNSQGDFPSAIPILINWLERIADQAPVQYYANITEGLVRALAMPSAVDIVNTRLIFLFQNVYDPGNFGLRWTIGNTLSLIYSENFFDDYVSLIEQKEFGIARQMLVEGLSKSSNPMLIEKLYSYLTDDDLSLITVKVLGKLKPPDLVQHLEPLLGDAKNPLKKSIVRTIRSL